MRADLLDAATPEAWLRTHLVERAEAFGHNESDAGARWLSRSDLLADEAAALRARFDELVSSGYPPTASATFVASYTAGTLADWLGYVLAGSGAGLEVDPTELRWRWHPLGYVDRMHLAGTFLVGGDDPWASLPGVEIVEEIGERVDRTVAGLVEAVTPLIDECRRLTRVGAAGLWNEVGDALGLSIAFSLHLPVREQVVDLMRRAVASPHAPWKARASLGLAESRRGQVYVGQKGGCCLAYTRGHEAHLDLVVAEATEPASTAGDGESEESGGCEELGDIDEERAWRERFPEQPGEPSYCTTCSLRDRADCEARQVFWVEHRPG